MDKAIGEIKDAAEEVHDILGPGHTESTYHRAMERELSIRGIGMASESSIPIFYKGMSVGRRRPDMFIDGESGTVVLELKAGSQSGKEQLESYDSILADDNNFNISGALLIRFNDDIEFESW